MIQFNSSNIRQFRRFLEMSQEQFAELAGVSEPSVEFWEREPGPQNQRELNRLAKQFGWKPSTKGKNSETANGKIIQHDAGDAVSPIAD